jgi:hypothetical protein
VEKIFGKAVPCFPISFFDGPVTASFSYRRVFFDARAETPAEALSPSWTEGEPHAFSASIVKNRRLLSKNNLEL